MTIPGFGIQRNEMAETPLIAMAETPPIEINSDMDAEMHSEEAGGTVMPSPKGEPVALGPGRRNKRSVAGVLTCPPENLAPSGLGKRGGKRGGKRAKNSVCRRASSR